MVEQPTFLEHLNDKQREICMSDCNYVLTACPGSGKTRLLTYRLAYLQEKYKDSRKYNIAITYTNRAADEIYRRLDDMAIDYHHIRAENAKRCYDYYLKKINTEEGYAEKLADEIRLRWKLYCTKKLSDGTIVHKPFDEKIIKGTYKTRGKNKKLAIEYGLPTEYNNLALAVVSIFHLAHWRNNVTVQSYLLSH